MHIRGKRVVVTGASSGIGFKLVQFFLQEGCQVVAAARGVDRITLTHENLHTRRCDVSSRYDVDSLFAYAAEKLGRIDVFVANAGFAYYERVGKPDWDHIKKIFDTNTLSVFYSAQRMAELCGPQPYSFVCIASAMSFHSLPGYALYSSTKAALRGFADAYRYELKKGQHFQVAYPIATKTNFFKNAGGSPEPWPIQLADRVARSVVQGIKRGRKNIYPSKTFWVSKHVFPFILKIYAKGEVKQFRRFLVERLGEERDV